MGGINIVILITTHPQMGILLTPYYVRPQEKDSLLVEEQATSYNKQLLESENKCIELSAKYSEQQLLKQSFIDGISADDFWKKADINQFRKYVRPYIDGLMYEMIHQIIRYNLPLYVKEAGDNVLYTFNRIRTQHDAAHAEFYFNLDKQGFNYRIRCYCEGHRLDLLHERPVITITQSPATMVLGQELYVVNNMNAPFLLPFLKRQEVFADYSQLGKYLNVVVIPAIRQYPSRCKGLGIFHKRIKTQCEILVHDASKDETHFKLRFKYGDYIISDDTLTYVLPVNNVAGELPTIYFFTRDRDNENRIITTLQQIGLEAEDNNQFVLKGNLYDWMQNNYNILKSLITFKQEETNNEIYAGKISVEQQITEKTDWFDVHIRVNIAGYEYSFYRFKDNIINRDPVFRLPNGQVVLLPTEWFEKYDNFFSLGTPSDGDNIRIKKVHRGVIGQIQDKSRDEYKPKQLLAVPKAIKATLRQYQVEGYSWLAHLSQNNMGGCLADDMGLGKTLQVITLLQYEYNSFPDKQASLIVVPTSLINNWINEVKRFSELTTYVFKDGARLDEQRTQRIFDHFDIIIASYSMLWRYIYLLKTYSFFYIVLDESQNIKNSTSITYRAAIRLNGQHRFVMTGTPIENSLKDLWSQFNFINPGLLNSVEYFQKHFIMPIVHDGNKDAIQNLQELIMPYFLRRTKKQVAPELPQLTEEVVYCDMTEEQRELYQKEHNSIRNMILEDHVVSNFELLSSISRLRQLANHPRMIFSDYQYISGKIEQVIDDFDTLRSEGHKVLLFSSFVKHLDLIKEEFEKHKWKYAMLTGRTQDRTDAIEYFSQNADVFAFLISLKAGGTGLNLTQADYVFILDPWWNPASEEQALSRAYRIGQDKNVFVYRYITKDSIEEKIKDLQKKKLNLSHEFITTNNPLESLSDEDWKELLA